MAREGILRWYGRQFHNALVNMPVNEQKRIIQILTEKTKPGTLKECIVPGKHEGKVAEGHSVQEAVMRRITSQGKVRSFAHLPVVSKREFPTEIGIEHALTGYFACEKHEDLFADVEKRVPEFDNEQHLLLLAYKALLKSTWDAGLAGRAWAAIETEDPESDLPKYLAWLHKEMEEGIGYYKYVAEKMLGIAQQPSPYETLPNVLRHIVVRVPSRTPAIAASAWTNGLGYRVTPTPRGPIRERIPQWGCTVYPMQEEHVVVYHFSATDAQAIGTLTSRLRSGKGTVRQREVSQQLLAHFEDIVITYEAWESFSEDKRDAIRSYFLATPPDMGITTPNSRANAAARTLSAERLKLINLFDGEP